ncbi:hypothetical protein LINGRAHAP2_LOCUS7551, partial [Linum grandiflorum]
MRTTGFDFEGGTNRPARWDSFRQESELMAMDWSRRMKMSLGEE